MIEGRQFAVCAGRFAAFSSGEPEWRSAVSRAYYGAFHHARDFLTATLMLRVPRNAAAHQKIIIALNYPEKRELKRASSSLGTLGGWRKGADYDIEKDPPGEQRRARDAVDLADQIIRLIDSCTERDDRAAAQRAIAGNIGLLGVGWGVAANL